MKLLMISPVPIVPPNTGGKVRIWQIANGLARHHHVTLVAPVYIGAKGGVGTKHGLNDENFSADSDLLYLPCHCAPPTVVKRLHSFCSRWPYHTALRYRQELGKSVQQALQTNRYDLIYCHFIQTLPYVDQSDLPIIVDQQNVDRIYWHRQCQNQERNLFQRWLAKHNLRKTVRYETSRLPQISSIVSVSECDRRATKEYADGVTAHFLVAPNGVDLAQYRPSNKKRKTNQLVLGFFGSMDLKSNQDAAFQLISQILPIVQQRLQEVEVSVLLIGRNPPQHLRQVAQSNPERRISLTGTVTDVLPHLHCVDILVLPLQDGAGTKLRVLEAMAAGICVVGTPLALAGLDKVQPGVHALLAATTEQMVEQICAVAGDEEWRHSICKAALQIVTRHYSWTDITDQLAIDLSFIYERGNPR